MRMCTRCKKNMAVIFVTKVENGTETSEGLCFSCAKQMGIKPFDKILEQFNINEEEFADMNEQLSEMMGDADMFGDNMTMGELPMEDSDGKKEKSGIFSNPKKQKNKRSFLDSYGTNLNDKAKNGEVDNVIGRENEIMRVINILNRRTKNNPVLIGDPGVGKTAIAEGLAVKIVNKEVPEKLLDMQIYLVDFAGMIAGTQFRGQFEQRLKSLITETIERKNVISF